MFVYNPVDWYWQVASEGPYAWSTGQRARIASDDPIFVTWLESGGRATPIPSVDDLWNVLNTQVPSIAIEMVNDFLASGELGPTSESECRRALGLEISSTATPTLDAFYSLDTPFVQSISGLVSSINAGQGLPGGGLTVGILDIDGIIHDFTADDLKAFFGALSQYLYLLNATALALNNGQMASWPTQPVEIP